MVRGPLPGAAQREMPRARPQAVLPQTWEGSGLQTPEQRTSCHWKREGPSPRAPGSWGGSGLTELCDTPARPCANPGKLRHGAGRWGHSHRGPLFSLLLRPGTCWGGSLTLVKVGFLPAGPLDKSLPLYGLSLLLCEVDTDPSPGVCVRVNGTLW